MQQNVTSEIRNIQTDLKQLTTNTSLYMQQSQLEISEINAKLNDIQKQEQTNSNVLSILQQDLNQRVSEIFREHEKELIQKIQTIQQEKEVQFEEEIKKRNEMTNKFIQLDLMVDKLDKKFELKANDKFIVSVIQNNLVNNQQLQQTLVEKAIKLIEDSVQIKVDEMQKWTEDKVSQQYYQIQNFQTYLRKSERIVEELQSSITLTKNSTIEFQKEFTGQINDIQLKNQIFKETVAAQVKNFSNTNNELKHQFAQLLKDIKNDFDEVKSKTEHNQIQFQNKLDAVNSYVQFSINSAEQRLVSQFLKEDQVISQRITENVQSLLSSDEFKITQIEQDLKGQSEAINQIREKLANLQKNQQVHQRLYQKKEGSISLNSKQTSREQITLVENLFAQIQSIYSQIHQNLKLETGNDVSIDETNRHCQSQIILIESQTSMKKLNVSPSRSPEQPVENNNNEKLDTKLSNAESIRIHDRSKSPLRILEKTTKNNKNLDDPFSDQKLYESRKYPLLVVGKTQLLDSRPQQELSALQQKIKKVQNMIGMDFLGQKPSVQRSSSATKRLPKINSKSLHFTID